MKQSETARVDEGIAPLAPDAPAASPGWRSFPLPGATVSEALAAEAQRRADARITADLQLELTSIDASRDRATGELYFATTPEQRTVNLSRRGMCVRSERPPEIGSRVLLQLRVPGQRPLDVIGRTRWTRVEFEPGEHASRAYALVGIELFGGAPRALALYDRALSRISALDDTSDSPVASVGGHR